MERNSPGNEPRTRKSGRSSVRARWGGALPVVHRLVLHCVGARSRSQNRRPSPRWPRVSASGQSQEALPRVGSDPRPAQSAVPLHRGHAALVLVSRWAGARCPAVGMLRRRLHALPVPALLPEAPRPLGARRAIARARGIRFPRPLVPRVPRHPRARNGSPDGRRGRNLPGGAASAATRGFPVDSAAGARRGRGDRPRGQTLKPLPSFPPARRAAEGRLREGP